MLAPWRPALYHKRTFSVLSCLLLCLTAPVAGAQDRQSSANTELLLAGEQTITTASKKSQRVQDVPAAVTIITEEDIRASGAVTLLDLLRSAPGVDVIEPNSALANVSIRGFNSQFANKLLVMIDGRSIYQESFGGVFWSTNPLLISRIKRIEIVRGPGSVLYGANAFNGVINIITRTSAEMAAQPLKNQFRSLVGERGGLYNEVQLTDGKANDWSYSFGAGYNRTSGLGERKAGEVRDSYTTPILTLDLQKRLKRGSLQFAMGNSEATSDFAQQGLNMDDSRWHTSYFLLNFNEDKTKNPVSARLYMNSLLENASGVRTQDANTYDFEIQQQRALSAAHNLVYGASYRHADVTTAVTGTATHREDLGALYLQDDIRLNKQTHLFAGVRLDEHSLSGTHFTPRLSLVQHLPKKQSIRLSYGSAFRNPTIVNSYLYSVIPLGGGLQSVTTGNPDLKPETVTSYEAGYRKELKDGYVGLNLFYNRAHDLMEYLPTAFAPSPPFPAGTPLLISQFNARDASAVGFEVESEFRLGKSVRGQFNYAYQDVKDSLHQWVDLSPHHKINLALTTRLPHHFEAALITHYVGSSVFHNNGMAVPVDSYTRLDARVGHRFGMSDHALTLSLIATNLLDDHHQELPMVTAPGAPREVAGQRRTVYASLTGKF